MQHGGVSLAFLDLVTKSEQNRSRCLEPASNRCRVRVETVLERAAKEVQAYAIKSEEDEKSPKRIDRAQRSKTEKAVQPSKVCGSDARSGQAAVNGESLAWRARNRPTLGGSVR
jgi:hypothetical protein